jgi:hypothetical protein
MLRALKIFILIETALLLNGYLLTLIINELFYIYYEYVI